MPEAIDGQVAAYEERRGRWRPAGQRPHAGDELDECERLSQVVVSAQFQSVYPVVNIGSGGEHEDPRARPGQFSAHLVSVHHREIAVEHEYVVGRERTGVQRRRAVIGDVHSHPGLT